MVHLLIKPMNFALNVESNCLNKYKKKEDGTAQNIQSSYFETIVLNDKLYMCWIGSTQGSGNLRVRDLNGADDSDISLGTTDYWYYTLCNINGLPKMDIKDGELYLRVSKVANDKKPDGSLDLEDPAVYKLNLKTEEMTRVSQSQEKVFNAQMVGDNIYYLSSKSENQANVYKHSLKDGTEKLLGSYKCEELLEAKFAVVGDNVFYITNETLYLLGKNESLNPNEETTSISITGDNREYVVCTFKETAKSKYRIMIFDKLGNVVFKTSDSGNNIIIEGKTLYFYNITTETLCKTTIK